MTPKEEYHVAPLTFWGDVSPEPPLAEALQQLEAAYREATGLSLPPHEPPGDVFGASACRSWRVPRGTFGLSAHRQWLHESYVEDGWKTRTTYTAALYDDTGRERFRKHQVDEFTPSVHLISQLVWLFEADEAPRLNTPPGRVIRVRRLVLGD